MTAEIVDLDPIIPGETQLTIEGIPARVKRLRAREVFGLARIMSNGLGQGILDMDLDTEDEEQLRAHLLGMILVALPNAVEETMAFLSSVVAPVNSKDERKLRALLNNPSPVDMVAIVEALVEQEAEDLFGLVGKVRALWGQALTLYRDHKPKTTG